MTLSKQLEIPLKTCMFYFSKLYKNDCIFFKTITHDFKSMPSY